MAVNQKGGSVKIEAESKSEVESELDKQVQHGGPTFQLTGLKGSVANRSTPSGV